MLRGSNIVFCSKICPLIQSEIFVSNNPAGILRCLGFILNPQIEPGFQCQHRPIIQAVLPITEKFIVHPFFFHFFQQNFGVIQIFFQIAHILFPGIYFMIIFRYRTYIRQYPVFCLFTRYRAEQPQNIQMAESPHRQCLSLDQIMHIRSQNPIIHITEQIIDIDDRIVKFPVDIFDQSFDFGIFIIISGGIPIGRLRICLPMLSQILTKLHGQRFPIQFTVFQHNIITDQSILKAIFIRKHLFLLDFIFRIDAQPIATSGP